MKEFSEYEGYQGREGNTFYYSDREAMLGSAGMAYVAFVLAAIALTTGLVVRAWKWRFGLVDGLRTLGTVVVVCGITGAMSPSGTSRRHRSGVTCPCSSPAVLGPKAGDLAVLECGSLGRTWPDRGLCTRLRMAQRGHRGGALTIAGGAT